jgi:large subunit ribosomal protein L25
MPETTLHAEVGRPLGSPAARRLRAAGLIPGVVYGHGTDPVPVAVEGRQLRVALSGEAGVNTLIELVAGDATFLTLAREIQRDPVRGTVTHVDFQIVRRDEVMTADVPIVLVGEAIEVAHADGLVDQQLFSLPIKARPADIPASVEVDVSGLTVGGAIRVADLPLPDGVTTDLDPETSVVTGVAGRLAQVPGEEGAGEAGLGEGEAGGGAASAEAEG